MERYTREELSEALRAIDSTIRKCEKIEGKESLGASQKTLLINRLKALRISSALITKAIEEAEEVHSN